MLEQAQTLNVNRKRVTQCKVINGWHSHQIDKIFGNQSNIEDVSKLFLLEAYITMIQDKGSKASSFNLNNADLNFLEEYTCLNFVYMNK